MLPMATSAGPCHAAEPEFPPEHRSAATARSLGRRRRGHRQFRRRASRPSRRHRAGAGSGAAARQALRRPDLRTASVGLFRRRRHDLPPDQSRRQGASHGGAWPRRHVRPHLRLCSGGARRRRASCATCWRGGLAPRAVVVGYDFHFGARRSGTPAYLREAGPKLGIEVEIVEKVVADEEGSLDAVSSTATREALQCGDVRAAAALLGHYWSLTGRSSMAPSWAASWDIPPPISPSTRPAACATPSTPSKSRSMEAGLMGAVSRASPVSAAAPRWITDRRCLKFLFSISPRTFTVATSKCSSSHSCEARRNSKSLDALVAQIRRDEEQARKILGADSRFASDAGRRGHFQRPLLL